MLARTGRIDICNEHDAVMGCIGPISHDMGLLMGAIELSVLCTFICRVGYFDAQIRETLLYKEGLTYLPSLEKKQTNCLQRMKYKTTCIPHHFLYFIIEKNIAQIPSHPFVAK